MPSLIDIRRRIRSVKNTRQITKAMKMVSAAKLRRAQERALASRPYATMMNRVLAHVARAATAEDPVDFPLLLKREEKRVQVIVVTSDRGLAGAFNANLLRMTQRFIDERRGTEIRIEAIGRKGRDYFRKRGFNLTGEHIGEVEKPQYSKAAQIADRMIDQYRKAEVDGVYLAVNEFKSVMAPSIVMKKILPVELPSEDTRKNQSKGDQAKTEEKHEEPGPIDYIYGQPPDELMRALLPRYVEMEIYRAMLESNSAEHAARMTAMDTASSNAGEVIDTLTLQMNRVRQASITREIIEIVSGAAAAG
jgi:F-type H+-transporting ATPase subunit gamma